MHIVRAFGVILFKFASDSEKNIVERIVAMSDFLARVPLVRTSEDFVARAPHGHRVTDPRPASGEYEDPQYVYLIYMTQEADHGWIARHMYFPKGNDPDVTAANLFAQARAGDKSNQVGENLIGLKWKEPCIVYLVLDLDDTTFIDQDAPEFDPLFFVDEKPILGSNPVVYARYDENHAFFEGNVITISGRSAFRCTNYLTDEGGNQIIHPKARYYGLEIRYLAPWNATRRPHVIDPDGQNQGPPRLIEIVVVPE
jgi:hypothetical protein